MGFSAAGFSSGVWDTGPIAMGQSVLIHMELGHITNSESDLFQVGIRLHQACLQFCPYFLQIGLLGAAVIFTSPWKSSQLNVKQRWWESVPPRLRQRTWVRKGWNTLSGFGVMYWLNWRSLSISGSCSWMREEWRGRLIGRSVQHLQQHELCSSLLWLRQNWAKRKGSLFSGQSTILNPPMVTNCGWRPKEWYCGYKRLKSPHLEESIQKVLRRVCLWPLQPKLRCVDVLTPQVYLAMT